MRSSFLSAVCLAVCAGRGTAFAANVITSSPDHWFNVNSLPSPGRNGYVFYATGATAGHPVSGSSAIGISTGTLASPVNYVTINTSGDLFLGSSDAGNTQLTIAGSTVTSGMAYKAVTGRSAELATLTLGPNTPSIFRLGVLVDNVGGAANSIFWPTVTGLNGDVTGLTRGNSPPQNDIDLYYVVDAHAGDVIPVSATVRPGATNAAIGGFTFDLPLPGDANLDGTVNFTDLLVLAQNYGVQNGNWQHGDFNGDGRVNFADLLLLAQNYGRVLDNPAPPMAVAVPDPGLSGGLPALLLITRRRRKTR